MKYQRSTQQGQSYQSPPRDWWSKFWEDKHGNIVIWQMPNIPLIGWAVFTVLSIVFIGRLADVFSWLGSAALIIWCFLEIFKGVNYFRRLLGLVVLVFAVLILVKSL